MVHTGLELRDLFVFFFPENQDYFMSKQCLEKVQIQKVYLKLHLEMKHFYFQNILSLYDFVYLYFGAVCFIQSKAC